MVWKILLHPPSYSREEVAKKKWVAMLTPWGSNLKQLNQQFICGGGGVLSITCQNYLPNWLLSPNFILGDSTTEAISLPSLASTYFVGVFFHLRFLKNLDFQRQYNIQTPRKSCTDLRASSFLSISKLLKEWLRDGRKARNMKCRRRFLGVYKVAISRKTNSTGRMMWQQDFIWFEFKWQLRRLKFCNTD